ncbi:MAG: PASTA domain-containing protein [Alistipes sp.]|nr:PASTA domain-containing protein [Alistipes sp.]
MAEKRQKSNNAKEDIINRVYFLYGIFILLGLIITVRLVWIQAADKSVEQHIALMNKNIINSVPVIAHRGAILTRNGEPLAMSSRRYEPLFDFAAEGMTRTYKKSPTKVLDELQQLAQNLALHFNKADAEKYGYTYRSAEQYFKFFEDKYKATKDNRSVRIFPRPVVLDEWNMMRRDFPIINYSLGKVYKEEYSDIRIRPYEDLALQLIGECRGEKATTTYTRIVRDSNGVEHEKIGYRDTILRRTSGLERSFDSLLAGSNGRYHEQRIAHGFWARIDNPNDQEPIDGHDIVTTIDGDLQRMATECLRDKLEKECASFGVAMVMEVETGNMLCMVNLTSGRIRGRDYQEGINHAMRTRLTPGSTFKLASTMAMLEIGNATLNTRVAVNDVEEQVGKRPIRDAHPPRDDDGKTLTNPTLLQGFANSSNIFFARAIYNRWKDNPSLYTSYLEGLLFNSHIGLEHLGAKRGMLPPPDSRTWKLNGGKDWVLPQIPYGYIVEIPPIQTLTFYNGVANRGKMVAPRFVDRVERNGITTEVMPTVTLLEHMCSEQTINDLFTCLEEAAKPNHTSRKFVGLPVKIGCKTGTAQLWGKFPTLSPTDTLNFREGFGKDKHLYYFGSLVAVMPLDNPKYTIMVALAKEKTDSHPNYYGISLTGDVMREIIEYLHTNDLSLHESVERGSQVYTPTTIKQGRSTSVSLIAESLCDVDYNNGFDTEWSSASISNSGNARIESLSIESGSVPNVVGMGLSDALYLLEQQGLSVTHSGYGRVRRQSLEPGLKITSSKAKSGSRGRAIHLTLSI